MTWTDVNAHVYAVGEVVTAATMNTYIRLDLDDLDRRTVPVAASVVTSETTTSTTYANLATVGPAVTALIGSTSKALVALYSSVINNTGSGLSFMTYQVTGGVSTNYGPSDADAIGHQSATASQAARIGAIHVASGVLTLGSNVFTAKYRVNGGTGTFQDRRLSVTPLGA